MTPSESASAARSVASIAQSERAASLGRPEESWRLRVYTIIFESDTRAGLLFDLLLILLVLASVAVVILDSVQSMRRYDTLVLLCHKRSFALALPQQGHCPRRAINS
jgi:voltage-gated potassium channel